MQKALEAWRLLLVGGVSPGGEASPTSVLFKYTSKSHKWRKHTIYYSPFKGGESRPGGRAWLALKATEQGSSKAGAAAQASQKLAHHLPDQVVMRCLKEINVVNIMPDETTQAVSKTYKLLVRTKKAPED